MPKAVGSRSFVAYGMQSAFYTAQTTLVTAAHLRSGTVLSPRQGEQPRLTTGSIMPRSSQYWTAMALVDMEVGFEYVFHDTAWLPWLTASWGKRIKTGASAPFNYQFLLNDPPVDPSTADSGGTAYNRGLTIKQTLHDGTAALATIQAKDVCINTFTMEMPANDSMKIRFTGTGQNYTTSSAETFTDVAGTTAAWNHAIQSANGGLYVGTATPPATAVLARNVTFTLDNNLRYEPFLGAAAGNELSVPHRAGFPSARFDFEMDFENTTGKDAVDLITDYVNKTRQNCKIEYYLSANESVEIILTGSTDGGIVDSPKPVLQNEGVAGFTFTLICAPDEMAAGASDDLCMNVTTGT